MVAVTRAVAVGTLWELTGPRDPTEAWSFTGTGRTLASRPSGAWTQQGGKKDPGLSCPQHGPALCWPCADWLAVVPQHRVGRGSVPPTPK